MKNIQFGLKNKSSKMKKLKYLFLRISNKIKFLLSKNISKKIFLGPNVQIFGLDNIVIKDYCTIGENTQITINNRSKKTVQLTIGSNVYIGRDNFISVGESVKIGDYGIFGNKCSIICSDHIFDNPLIPYASSGNSFEKRIKIGVNCWFGHQVTIVGNIQIGHGSIIGANTLITKDIPPFSMVVGSPAKIIKTFDFKTNKWEKTLSKNDSPYLEEGFYLNYLLSNSGNVHLAYHSASSKLGHL